MAESIQEDPEYNRWRGLEANGFYFEEINECRKNTFLKAIERAGSWKIRKQPPILVLASCNPTHNWVYDIWYKKSVAGLLDAPFYFQQANIFDNPYLDPEYLESLKNLPAEIYRRFVEGSWDAIDDLNQLISWEALHACGRLIDTDDKTQCLGVDVARFGGDRSVWTRLEGPNIKEIISFDKTDVVEVAEKTERIITLNHISADHVCLDAVGLGAGAVDILRKKSYYIIEMRGGDAPKRTGDRTYSFFNLRSQSFWLLAEEIKHSRLGELTDETLKSDLSSLWYFIQQDRKIRIESKEDLKKRLGRSPDFADSLCYANWAKVHSSLYAPMFSTTSQLAKEETHE